MKKNLRNVAAVLLFFSPALACGEVSREVAGDRMAFLMTNEEVAEMHSVLKSWDDVSGSALSPEAAVTEEDIKKIYEDFADAIVEPPLPGAPAPEWAGQARSAEALGRLENLGKKARRFFMSMPDEDFERYGRFLGMMAEVLYVDARRVKEEMSDNTSWDERWKNLHAVGVKEVEREYIRIAIESWGVEVERSEGTAENGYGTAVLPDGSVYEGYFENGLFNGKGTRAWKDGHRYEGGYRDGLPYGKGVEIWSDGTRYEGEFREGRWYGKGVVTWKDGRSYEVENK